VVTVYGCSAAVWRILVGGSIMIAVSWIGHGAGVILCAAAMAAWCAPLATRLIEVARQQWREAPWTFCRAAAVLSVAISTAVAAWSWLPWPGVRSAPGIVDYQNLATVRSHTAGFVETIHVRDGESVAEGSVLLEIRNDELQHDLRQLAVEIEQAEVQRRFAREQQQIGEAQVQERNLRALQERQQELLRRQQALLVRAPCSGSVVARNLEQLLGCHVQEGDELLIVGKDSDKELILAISQDQLQETTRRRGQPIQYRVGVRAMRTGILDRVEPRATREPPHPALRADAGGRLPVTQTASAENSAESRLVDPHFRAIVKLDSRDSRIFACGETGHAVLGAQPLPLGKQLWVLLTAIVRPAAPEATGRECR
jgi:putative peptide zinc metalloprotease protein